MAFDEVTLFEFDLTDAQFGPKDMNVPDRLKGKVDTGESAEGDVEANVETEEDESGGMGKTILMGVVALVVVGLVAKRMRGGSDEEESTAIEFDEDEEAPEIGA